MQYVGLGQALPLHWLPMLLAAFKPLLCHQPAEGYCTGCCHYLVCYGSRRMNNFKLWFLFLVIIFVSTEAAPKGGRGGGGRGGGEDIMESV